MLVLHVYTCAIAKIPVIFHIKVWNGKVTKACMHHMQLSTYKVFYMLDYCVTQEFIHKRHSSNVINLCTCKFV